VPDGSRRLFHEHSLLPRSHALATVARAKMSLRHMLYRCFARTCPRVLSRRCQSNSPSSRRGGAGVCRSRRVPDGVVVIVPELDTPVRAARKWSRCCTSAAEDFFNAGSKQMSAIVHFGIMSV
jgi:hypothetical protein